MPIGDYLRGRSVGQWLVGGFVAALGVSALVWGTHTTMRDLELRSHGIQVQATVESVTRQGRNSNYLVEYALQDGTQESAWIGDLGSGTREGDAVAIVYQRSSPSTIDTPYALSRWWITLFAAPFGAFFIWIGWRLWSVSPEAYMRMLRRRYGGR